MSEFNEHIESILDETFKVIDVIFSNNREDISFHPCKESRLVFPRYSLKHKDDMERKAKTRVSEQELRFAFVEQFNKICEKENWPYYYSVETPTDKRYVFSQEIEPQIAEKNKGVSGQFDLVVYNDKGERICCIEFKAGMSPVKEFAKDFLKQNKDGSNYDAYFVHLLGDNADNRTLMQIASNRICMRNKVKYVCHIINGETYSEGSERWKSLL